MLESIRIGIGNYFTHNFMGAENNTSYIAGMNFTNLIIAVPIIATILLLISSFIRSKFTKYIPNGLFDCKFMSVTLILYVLISWIFINLLGHQLSINIILLAIICYIPFYSLSWCIYNEFCFTQTYIELDGKDTDSYQAKFLTKIKQKIQEIKSAPKVKNILINGSWGAGKSYFIEKHLRQTPSLVYLSCTDYADTHELITALIEKTNNCLFRWLVRLSISRILAILGKFELKQFIGINKVIVFDEFERLVDYNKIDPMHIVSLIQYLNNQKNCICILVANDEPLNNNSQFTNVREKLISYICHYKLPFDEAINIIQKNYLSSEIKNLGKKAAKLKKTPKFNFNEDISKIETIESYNEIISHLNSAIDDINRINPNKNKVPTATQIINVTNPKFSDLKKHLEKWYQIDNNIRMIEHLYIKINQLYQATIDMIDEDEFYKEGFSKIEKKNDLFSGSFTYIDTVIIQLYYLYLKNPYFLSVIGQFAEIYHDDTFIKKEAPTNTDGKKTTQLYFIKNSLQQLSTLYTERDDYQKHSKIVRCFAKIQSNDIFANINQKLVIDYIANYDFIVNFLSPEEVIPDGIRQNIQTFMRKFKEIICESDDSTLVVDYFKKRNILQARFSKIVDDATKLSPSEVENSSKSTFDYSIVTDYTAYCQYIDATWTRSNPNNIRPVCYDRIAYINALIIQYLWEKCATAYNDIIDTIGLFYSKDKKTDLISIIYELTAQQAAKKRRLQNYINLILQIVMRLLRSNKKEEDYSTLLNFMYQSYFEIKFFINFADIELCNNNMINLLQNNIRNKSYCDSFFALFTSFNKEIIQLKQDKNIVQNYITQVSQLITTLSQYYKSIILLNQLNMSYSAIIQSLEDSNIIFCNQSMIDLINLKHINEKSFLQTLFIHLANLNNDLTPESIPDNSFNYLLTKIRKIYGTDEKKQSLIDMFNNNSNFICQKVMKKLQEELNNNKNNETTETEGKE